MITWQFLGGAYDTAVCVCVCVFESRVACKVVYITSRVDASEKSEISRRVVRRVYMRTLHAFTRFISAVLTSHVLTPLPSALPALKNLLLRGAYLPVMRRSRGPRRVCVLTCDTVRV